MILFSGYLWYLQVARKSEFAFFCTCNFRTICTGHHAAMVSGLGLARRWASGWPRELVTEIKRKKHGLHKLEEA
jgi:hypothetical protein